MADSTTTDELVSFETTNEGMTVMTIVGADDEGEDATVYLSLNPQQMGNLAGRTTKQWFGATIIAN